MLIKKECSHLTDENRYIVLSRRLMATKLDKMMAQDIGPPHFKLIDLLDNVIICSVKIN